MNTIEKKIDKLIGIVATKDDITGLTRDIAGVKATVDLHTTSLDGIAKQVVDLSTDKMVLVHRLERYEKFMKVVAKKLSLDLRSILN